LWLLYRWVEHAFGGREHELTGAYDDAEPVLADLRRHHRGRAGTRTPLRRPAAVEAYLYASALRMVASYRNGA